MNAIETLPESPAAHVEEPLLQLQLQVARRADALARFPLVSPLMQRLAWLRAEQEIFECLEQAERPMK